MAYVQGESLKVMLPSCTVFNLPASAPIAGNLALKSEQETTMQQESTCLRDRLEDIGDCKEALHTSIDALRGFSALLGSAISFDATALKPYSEGIRELLERQIEDLDVIYETIHTQYMDYLKRDDEVYRTHMRIKAQEEGIREALREQLQSVLDETRAKLEAQEAGQPVETAEPVQPHSPEVERVIDRLTSKEVPSSETMPAVALGND